VRAEGFEVGRDWVRRLMKAPSVRIVVVFILYREKSNRGRQESEKGRNTVKSSESKWYGR
jgi:hypothetical protein